jgi:hypothetical protein
MNFNQRCRQTTTVGDHKWRGNQPKTDFDYKTGIYFLPLHHLLIARFILAKILKYVFISFRTNQEILSFFSSCRLSLLLKIAFAAA